MQILINILILVILLVLITILLVLAFIIDLIRIKSGKTSFLLKEKKDDGKSQTNKRK